MSYEESIQDIVEHATELHRSGQTDHAVDILNNGLAKVPNDPSLLIQLGIFEGEHGNHAQSILAFEMAIEVDPENPVPYSNLALSLTYYGDKSAAKELIHKAISLAPKEPDYHAVLAFILNALGLYKEAVQEYDLAVSLGTSDIGVWMGKALALIEIAEQNPHSISHTHMVLAKDTYQAATECALDHAEAYYGLGYCEFYLKNYRAAAHALSIATTLEPNQEHYYLALGSAQVRYWNYLGFWRTARKYCKLKLKNRHSTIHS